MIEEKYQDPEEDQEDVELYEHYKIEVDPGQTMLRIDKFLMGRIENVSRNKIQMAATAGNILVDGKSVKQNYRVKPRDVITILMSKPPRITEIFPEDIPLNIVYEDDFLLVVDKPAGLVVHPGYGNFTGTMLNGLLFHMKDEMAKNPDKAPLLAHRIDKDTSGLILVGKDERTQALLARQFFYHTIKRQYLAMVWGIPKEDEGTITGHIGRSLKDRRVMTVFPDGSYGKHAVTHYSVVEKFGYVSLVECRLETGRTHQIRAHLKHIGHPLFSDSTYGGDQILKGTTFTKYKQFVQNCFKIIPRQALHAQTLGFYHPILEKELEFFSKLPDDMNELIEKWRGYVSNRNFEEE